MYTELSLFHWMKSLAGNRAPLQARALLIALSPALLFSGCAFQEFERQTLEAQDIVARLVDERRVLRSEAKDDEGTVEGELDIERAAQLLRDRNPDFREALAVYETAKAKAAIKTARPNPSLGLGPGIGLGSGIADPRVVPVVGLGIELPTAGKLTRMDELNAARVLEARVQALTTYRELYLELRRRYASLAVSEARSLIGQQIVQAAARSLAATEALVAAGSAQALDVSLFTLELARERARAMEIRAAMVDASSRLASLLAIDAEDLPVLPSNMLPHVPDETPSLTALQERLTEEQPLLQRLQVAHVVSERALHLEIARQYPNLSLNTAFAGEVSESFSLLSIALGMAMPIFDRNRQAIAEAHALCYEARVRYEGAANAALSELQRAQRAAALATALRRMLQADVLPAAQSNVEVARRSLTAGVAGGLQVLDTERSLREVELEVIEAEFAELMAWCDMERALGAPLLIFGPTNDPMPPAPLIEQEDER